MASTTTYVAARSAAQFDNSVGVNTKINAYNYVYSNATKLIQELQTLGISNVRDATPTSSSLPIDQALARAGVHFDLMEANPSLAGGQVNGAADVARAHQLQASVPGSVVALEGVNEYTGINASLWGSSSYNNLQWGVNDAQQLQAAAKADSLFSNTTIIAPSAIQMDSLPHFGSYVGATNAHTYGQIGGQLAHYIQYGVLYAQNSDPGKPVYITETGISSNGNYSYSSTDEKNQAIIVANGILDGFADGAAKTYLYELMDDPTASAGVEQHFGLFRSDGSAKPAAVAVDNIMHILADSGTGGVSPGGLSYSISGLPSTAQSMLLEKSNGTYELVLWNSSATVFNGSSDVTPPTSNVTVTLSSTAASVHIYDPVQSASSLQNLSNTSTITVPLSADPIIIELSGNSGATSYAASPASTTASLSSSSSGSSSSSTTATTVIAPYVSDVVASGSRSEITGHAAAGSRVAVSDNGTAVGTATADSSGNWSLTYTPSSAAQHHLTEIATSTSGAATSSAGTASFGTYSQAYTGTSGPDVFIGNGGDTLTGGGGADTFVFNSSFGKESIVDYTSADKLVFDHHMFADAASVLSHAAQHGSDVVITYNHWNVLTLHNVALSSLSASNIAII
jgi:hypothetical protein